MEQFLYKRKIKKNPKINCIFAFPGVESFALSSVGYLSIFKSLDTLDCVNVERFYTNSKTTITPVQNVDIVGFSVSFELDFIQVFKIFEKLNIPFLTKDRDESSPIVFAGGPVMTSNPLPYSEIFDFVCIGDSNTEKIFTELEKLKSRRMKKGQILEKLSEIEGVWVCKFGDKKPVEKVQNEISVPVYTPIISEKSFFKNTFIIETSRGCPVKCNFCLASWHNLPARFADVGEIIKAIDFGLKHTNKIALLGAYVAGHPDFGQIMDYISQKNKEGKIELSVSSLRADLETKIAANIFKTLVQCGALTVTIAIEAGSERMRKTLNKNLTDSQIENIIRVARESGLKGLKMYSMIGLPNEADNEVQALVDLMKKLKTNNKGFDLSISLNSFIPKPHTPFQRARRENKKSLEKKAAFLKKELHKIGVNVTPSSIDWDGVQSLLSRYPASLGSYLIDVYKNGAKLGAFKQCWRQFAKENKLPKYDDVVVNPLKSTDTLPWDFIKLF